MTDGGDGPADDGGSANGPPGVYRAMHARTTTELGTSPSGQPVRPPGPPAPGRADGPPPGVGPTLPPLRTAASVAPPALPARPPERPPDRTAVPPPGSTRESGTTPTPTPDALTAALRSAGTAATATPARGPTRADGPDAVAGSGGVEFDVFYRERWDGVARALALALGDRDLAVDATDEAMARAYPRWGQLRTYDNPAGWVYRVGLNWARSHHRRLARRLPFSQPESVDPAPVPDPAVHRALLDLPVRQRSVVVCRLVLDWSVEETAAALDVRPGTVRSRLHRALQTLEASLHHLR